MKLSELIRELQYIMNLEGDMQIMYWNKNAYDGDGDSENEEDWWKQLHRRNIKVRYINDNTPPAIAPKEGYEKVTTIELN